MNITLIICLALIIVPTLLGMKRGLIMSVYRLLGIVLVIGLTIILNPAVSKMAKNNATVYNFFFGIVSDNVNLPESGTTAGSEAIQGLKLPKALEDKALELVEEYKGEADKVTDKVENVLHEKLTDMLITGVSFIVTLIIVTIVVWLAFKALDLISKLKFLNFVNKFAGTALGFAEGLIIVWTLCGIIPMISTTTFGQKLITDISSSRLLTFIYENNLISKILSASIIGFFK